MMTYQIVEVKTVKRPAPELRRSDILTMTEAADMLRTSIYNLRNMLDRGDLPHVIDDENLTPAGTPKRYLLRSDVERLMREREKASAA